MEISDPARRAAEALADVKGRDLILINMAKKSSFADYFVIVTGDSPVHMRALSNRVRESMASEGERVKHSEGRASQHWILLDFNSVVVHIFSQQARPYYGLESLWGDTEIIQWNDGAPALAAASSI
ncbi:ribosome silencing factor [bacterium]|nr:ribosome silencing factor [bacterium]